MFKTKSVIVTNVVVLLIGAIIPFYTVYYLVDQKNFIRGLLIYSIVMSCLLFAYNIASVAKNKNFWGIKAGFIMLSFLSLVYGFICFGFSSMSLTIL